jgi:hypothetical protein
VYLRSCFFGRDWVLLLYHVTPHVGDISWVEVAVVVVHQGLGPAVAVVAPGGKAVQCIMLYGTGALSL